MSGKAVRGARAPFHSESQYSIHDEHDNLSSARRNAIATNDPGRHSRTELAKITRIQQDFQANPDRDVAVQHGWFSVKPVEGDKIADDIASGQSHRLAMEERMRPEPVDTYSGSSGDARNMGTRTSSAHLPHPIQARQATNLALREPIVVQAPLSTTRQSGSSTTGPQCRGMDNPPSNILGRIHLDPALDHTTRQGHYGRLGPGGRPQSNNGASHFESRRSDRKKKTTKPTAPHPTRAPPKLHPNYASGNLAVNPPPKPTTVSEDKITAFLSDKWANVLSSPKAPTIVTAVPAIVSVPDTTSSTTYTALSKVLTDAEAETSSYAIDHDSASESASDVDEELDGPEQRLVELAISDDNGCSPLSKFVDQIEVDDTPSTTPEPVTPLSVTAPRAPVNIQAPNLMDNEPSASEMGVLPEVKSFITSQTTIQENFMNPKSEDIRRNYHQALQTQANFEKWYYAEDHGRKTKRAVHTPATNQSQFVNDGFKAKGLMSSKYAN